MITFTELLELAKTEKIAIHTPMEAQAITLLTKLDKKGYVWSSGDKLTSEAFYEDEKENTCYSFYYCHGKLLNKKVMYSPLDWYQDFGYTIIEFGDIDFKEKK